MPSLVKFTSIPTNSTNAQDIKPTVVLVNPELVAALQPAAGVSVDNQPTAATFIYIGAPFPILVLGSERQIAEALGMQVANDATAVGV